MKAPVRLLAVIDANSSGVSGDKYLGALVNMGGRVESLRKVARVVAEYLPGTSRVEVEARRVERGGIGGHTHRCPRSRPPLRGTGTGQCNLVVHARCCWWRHLSLFRPFVSEPTSGCS